ncbi:MULTISPECIES: glycosyltransferase [Hydrocarboniphaga]|uniref:glycosyltransferase n=1 Tax=Hydrocarboniphaga TaxID=243627 RepID=UPI0012FCEBA7|nr:MULTISPECIES: glycosyltransferase [Hydrocarboniphaga]MDZ4077992.1 glycosyltransferase [Hydrocarboniphaga sp.]
MIACTFMLNVPKVSDTFEGWVVWKLNRPTPSLASVRYRCLIPILAHPVLRARSVILDGDRKWRTLRDVRALIFVKSFRRSDVTLARDAARKGVPIYVDICDNIFANGYGGRDGKEIRRNFLALAALADKIVTNGEGLNAQLSRALPAPIAAKLEIQVDPFETRELVSAAIDTRQWPNKSVGNQLTKSAVIRSLPHKLRQYFSPAQQQQQQQQKIADATSELPQVLWFGSSGNAHNSQGLVALSARMPELVRVYARVPFRLCIVSDNRERYEALISHRGIPSSFEQWGPLSIFDALTKSRACLIPAMPDTFSQAKSANRLLFALAHRVPVVASSIASYLPFADCVVLDDFEGGLIRYLLDPALCAAHLGAFVAKHERAYHPRHLAQHWSIRLGIQENELNAC